METLRKDIVICLAVVVNLIQGVLNMSVVPFDSPCPSIFEYAVDSENNLYGRVQISHLTGSVIRINVELSVGNNVQGYNGNIELGYARSKVIDDIVNGKPLLYKINFPVWRRFPPRVTKILVNGEQICIGPPINVKSVPVLTTINLQHTLRINITPGLSASSPEYPFDATSASNIPNQQPGQNSFNPSVKDIYIVDPQEGNLDNGGGANKDPSLKYPANPFFTTSRPDFHPRPTTPLKKYDIDPNQIITFAFPSTTKSTTEQIPFLDNTPIIDVRSDLEQVCGKSLATNSLIANGNPVARGHHPWLAALYIIQNLGLIFICGGNLISTKHVITAAHCMKRNGRQVRTDELLVILGKHNIQQWVGDSESEMLNALQVTIHPDYKEQSADADIAMIILSREVEFKKFIRPICLWSGPSELEQIVGLTGVVAGWGKDENGVQNSAEAKQVILPVVSQNECISSQETFQHITSQRTFCAGFRNGSGPCNGDSGGGFMLQTFGRWTLRGLVSMSLSDSTKNCDLSQYLVFTDVSKFLTWIYSFLSK